MLFAITIPVGSYHPFLVRTLQSLEAQTVPVQVALLDASSDPRVTELADQYAEFISYRHHGPDGGQADAIATGWNHLQGDVLGWLNADDRLYPDALARVAKAFDDGHDVVYGHSTIIDEEERLTGWQYGVEQPSPRLGHAAIISQPSCFFRRAAHDLAGGLNRSLHYTMDWDLFVRLFHSGAKFHFIDKALSQILWADDTKTSSLGPLRRQEITRMLHAHNPNSNVLKGLLGFGVQNLIDSAPPAIKRVLLRGLMKNPVVIGGLAPDGRCANTLTLPLCHYDTAPKRSASAQFTQAPGTVTATLAGEVCRVSTQGNLVLIEFPVCLSANKTAELELQFSSQQAPTFVCASLQD